MAMELRHLRYFVAVVEEGSVTTAAERRLHTSQTLAKPTGCRVGESRRTRVFEPAGKNVSAETCADARSERNPNAISAFIPSFSDLP
jgi:hypothetical protein